MKNNIDNTIYTASPEITRRRYNPLLGIVFTAGSIALLWANEQTAFFQQHDMLYQWNLLISSCILCTGITMICYRFFGDSSAPVEKKTKQRLYRTEHSFEVHDLPKVMAAVEQGNFTMLKQLPRCYQSAAQVICYATDSGSVLAAQVLRNQEPESDVRIFHTGEYAI